MMKLYLDDDTADRRLVQQLERDGHAVWVPNQVGLSGVSDARHVIHCCENELVLVSRNYDDFLELHLVIESAGGAHPGILIVRMDNDPKRDLTPRGIATAIGRFESAGATITGQFVILNHWR